ncbi:MAG: inositol monophosphatase [Austwickia sp.]|nr:inositol monophosphatase [Austwickia sp.]
MAQLGYADLRIPRLMDALTLLVGTGVGLLIDVCDPQDARAAWAVIEPFEAAGADLSVHWCGDPAAVAEIRRLSPSAIVYLATDTGSAAGPDLMGLRPTYLNMEGTLATAQVVRQAHDVGLGVSVWTIDDPEAMRYLLSIGVDAVITNEVRRLRAVLATPGLDPIVADPGGAPTELAVARDLAGWAAGYLRTVRPVRVGAKAGPADLVTDVDLDVERRVREVLAATFPHHEVVGEELGGHPKASGPCWYLDPVDGTTNFAHDLGWSCFSLALAVDGQPRLGVVANPWRGEVFWGASGLGAYLDSAPLSCAPAPEHGSGRDGAAGTAHGALAGSVVAMELDGHCPPPGMAEVMDEFAQRQVTARIMGSGAMAIASVAAGRAAAAIVATFDPIDHLAGLILAREAGAQVHDLSGPAPTFPTRGPLLVTAPWCARPMVEVFARYGVA